MLLSLDPLAAVAPSLLSSAQDVHHVNPVSRNMSANKKSRTADLEPRVPWPKTESDDSEVQEDWRAYCDRRYQECCQHAVALEYLLNKYPDQRAWLEKHGFDAQDLMESLRWYPTEELESLDKNKAKAAARSAEQEKLRKTNSQNYDRMQENLLRLLPLVREVQEELESVSTPAPPALVRTKISRNSSKHSSTRTVHSAYSSIRPIGAQWKV